MFETIAANQVRYNDVIRYPSEGNDSLRQVISKPELVNGNIEFRIKKLSGDLTYTISLSGRWRLERTTLLAMV